MVVSALWPYDTRRLSRCMARVVFYISIFYLRNRKHFPCFYRVIETRVEVWEKREIAWEHEHEVRVFPRNFEFLPNFHKCFYNSIGTRKKCFLFPLLNSLLKTIKKINLLILITFIQILILIYTFV